jgi:hypothetical protein
MMGKDNNNGLIGVALGALIVGTTLALRDIFEDPKNREAARTVIKNGYDKVKGGVQKGYATAKAKIGEGYAVAKTKAQEGYAVAKTKVGEGYAAVKEKATEGYATAKEKVQGGFAAVREKAEEKGRDIRTAVEESGAVKKIKEKVEDIRRATADPIEEYFREDLTVEDASAEAPASEATAVWDTPAE